MMDEKERQYIRDVERKAEIAVAEARMHLREKDAALSVPVGFEPTEDAGSIRECTR